MIILNLLNLLIFYHYLILHLFLLTHLFFFENLILIQNAFLLDFIYYLIFEEVSNVFQIIHYVSYEMVLSMLVVVLEHLLQKMLLPSLTFSQFHFHILSQILSALNIFFVENYSHQEDIFWYNLPYFNLTKLFSISLLLFSFLLFIQESVFLSFLSSSFDF